MRQPSRREFVRYCAAATAAAGVAAWPGSAARAGAAGWPAPKFVRTNGIRMAVHEAGDGFPVIFSHGFPELAYSWRSQVAALAGAGFRAIAPDQRGYGQTDRPSAVDQYTIVHLCGDLAGMMDSLHIDQAVFCGHDWGGAVVWMMPLLFPDRVAGVIGVNTAFLPRAPGPPIEMLRKARGENNYVVAFQQPGVADELLGKNVEKAFRLFFRADRMTAEQFAALPADSPARKFELLNALQAEIPPGSKLILSDDDLKVYVDTYTRTGFTGGINWYRNIDRNWELTKHVEYKVNVPSLYVGAADDVVLPPSSANGIERWVPDIEKKTIADCGHWTQQEKPEELNAILIDWLGRKIKPRQSKPG
jgi:pimeloyl-ACP methyl ester carboxylesterase